MRMRDYKELIIERSYDFIKDNSLGIVMKTPQDTGQNRYGVYIPRMMMGIPIDKGPYEKSIKLNSDLCLNSVNKEFGSSDLVISNYVNLTMDTVYNISMPRFIEGEQVTIGVIDQDIKSMYIKPFCRDHVKFRPTDSMKMYVPASGKYDGDDLDDTNSYYLKLDSDSKTIRLHMSNGNGEVSQYDLSIDGSSGILSLTDGKRSIMINTNDDEVAMMNEAKSTIAIRGDSIDMSCKKFYLNASDTIDITSSKGIVTVDNIDVVNKKMDVTTTTMSVTGTKCTTNFTKSDSTNTSRTITSPTVTVTGNVSVVGAVCPSAGIGFGVPAGSPPSPIGPNVNGAGIADFMGIGGEPLVKSTALIAMLQTIATQLDATTVLAAPIIPPLALSTVTSALPNLISIKVKG